MGKKGDDENLKSSFRMALKNLKKFLVIDHKKMYLHAYFHIFLRSRVLKKKKISNYRFFPMLFKWEIEALWGGGVQISRIGPFQHMEYFLLFFWKLFIWCNTDEKVDLGNKEHPNPYP